ncbi:transcriptional regulator [Chryseomicrobium excrementi]|uniref:Transcriptional regulator n=1 Tax=Chryseomicrobium excrementi TaxID=2041346 RepID=A0A2M9EWS7_9BACL|nr:helix-turn-helix transcriptional regulator [Chryseomicrobium excrementi]PJK15661.1 transcriptional regulator [Chryseomicrobium excrementi]
MDSIRWGRRIRAYRKLKRVSQIDLAKALEVAPATLGKMERGVKAPTEDQWMKISQILDIDMDELKGSKEGEDRDT